MCHTRFPAPTTCFVQRPSCNTWLEIPAFSNEKSIFLFGSTSPPKNQMYQHPFFLGFPQFRPKKTNQQLTLQPCCWWERCPSAPLIHRPFWDRSPRIHRGLVVYHVIFSIYEYSSSVTKFQINRFNMLYKTCSHVLTSGWLYPIE